MNANRTPRCYDAVAIHPDRHSGKPVTCINCGRLIVKVTSRTAGPTGFRHLPAHFQPAAQATAYGSPEHEAQLIELERFDDLDERPDQPWTPCGCTARAYGGDCAHTVDDEYENRLELVEPWADCGRRHIGYSCTLAAGHTGLHRSRGLDGILRHSWAAR